MRAGEEKQVRSSVAVEVPGDANHLEGPAATQATARVRREADAGKAVPEELAPVVVILEVLEAPVVVDVPRQGLLESSVAVPVEVERRSVHVEMIDAQNPENVAVRETAHADRLVELPFGERQERPPGEPHERTAVQPVDPRELVAVVHTAGVVGLVVRVVPAAVRGGPAVSEAQEVPELVKETHRVVEALNGGVDVTIRLAVDHADLNTRRLEPTAPGVLVGEAVRVPGLPAQGE